MIVVILAGGKGTRLWPLSSGEVPKQFLRIKDSKSLLQETYLRFANAKAIEKIVIVTSSKYKNLVEKHLSEINASCPIIIEPFGKNTLPAIALSIKYLMEQKVSLDQKVLVSPSDHFISPAEKFSDVLTELQNTAFNGNIITFGVKPTHPETGYGYINISKKEGNLYFAKKFVEKPILKKAKYFLRSKKYLWNAGFFLFDIATFWKELEKNSPEFFQMCQKKYDDFFASFETLPNISFDYAIMEKTKNIKIYPLDLSWSDIGSWDSVFEVMEKDEEQNVKSGNIFSLDTKNSLILASKRVVSTIGLENIIIVETEDGIFVGKKGESQKIKTLIEKLQKTSLKS